MSTLFDTMPLSIIDLPADEYHYSNDRIDYEFIVLHHTGGTDSRAWLSTTSPIHKPVSCHRLIYRRSIYKIVPDYLVAFTQGPACIQSRLGVGYNPNRFCLSIEIENLGNGEPYDPLDIALCADQCIEWVGAYGMMPIVYHRQIQSDKDDPYGFPKDMFDQFMMQRYAKYL